MTRATRCDWCGVELEPDESWQLLQPARNLGASFCRLEHVVPWLIKKNDWHIWSDVEVPAAADLHCAETGAELEDDAWYLVRRRGGIEIADGFSGFDAALAWAKAGGRYAPG